MKIGNLFLCTATSNFTFYVFGHSNVRNLSYYVAKAKCLLHLQINVRLSHGIQQKFSLVYRNGMYKATIIGPRQTCSLTASGPRRTSGKTSWRLSPSSAVEASIRYLAPEKSFSVVKTLPPFLSHVKKPLKLFTEEK